MQLTQGAGRERASGVRTRVPKGPKYQFQQAKRNRAIYYTVVTLRFVTVTLGLRQLQAGALALELQPLDLRGVVSDAILIVGPLFADKRQLIAVELPKPLPCRADPRRIEQVIVNLLANAHEYTPAGTRVTVSGATGPGVVRLAVADNGPGIAASEPRMIFAQHTSPQPTSACALLLVCSYEGARSAGPVRVERTETQTGRVA